MWSEMTEREEARATMAKGRVERRHSPESGLVEYADVALGREPRTPSNWLPWRHELGKGDAGMVATSAEQRQVTDFE